MQNVQYVDSVTTVSALMFMVQKLCDHIEFRKFINSQLRWDPLQWKTAPGLLAEALIMNTLFGRDALYKVEEFYEKIDTETLFGEGISHENFNDDAFAALLDRIHEANPKKLFSLFVFNALKHEDIFFESIHADTTSISLTGEYKEQQESAINVTFGHTKDHRPDLKQVMLGLIATKDGLPIFAEPLDGNKADSTWNKEVLNQIDDILYGDRARTLIYTADSSLITLDNLKVIEKKKLNFVSRLPGRFLLEEELKDLAWSNPEKWEDIGKFANYKKASSYYGQDLYARLGGRLYRFIVLRSDRMDIRKSRKIDDMLSKEKNQLAKEIAKLEKEEFNCRIDAEKALKNFHSKHANSNHKLTGTVIETHTEKRERGRPKKGSLPEIIVTYKVKVQIIEPNQEAIDQMKAKASSFVIMTNLLQTRGWTAKKVFREYKDQVHVERNFRFLKDPQLTGGIFVDKPHRIGALVILFTMAAFIATILQRRVRLALEKSQDTLRLVGGVKTRKPTSKRLLELLHENMVVCYKTGNESMRLWVKPNDNLAKVFKYGGIPLPKP
jgi:transposase